MQAILDPMPPTSPNGLRQEVLDAVEDRDVPISRLLRLIWALDAAQDAGADELRSRLRARIGEPLDA